MAVRDIIMAAAGLSAPPPPAGVSIVSGTRAPTLGSFGQNPFPASGWTILQSTSVDDASRFWSLGGVIFTITNSNYTGAYVGSNQYVTFGAGSSSYSSLSATNPPYNKIFICGADNSMQRVTYTNQYTGFSRLRMEGRASTSGTPGSPNIVWEMTFVDPSLTPAGVQYVEVLVGTQSRTTGQGGVASTNTFYVNTARLLANRSYVFVGNATGTSWTSNIDSYLDGVPY